MRVLRIKLTGTVVFTSLLLFGCGSMTDATDSSSAVIKRAEHLFELECRESAQFLAVDPARARTHVPAGYSVFVSGRHTADVSRGLPDGSAIFMMIYQECSSAIWDGAQLAPLKMLHQWIRIEGPPEVLPVAGTVTTVPTYYWYMLDDPTPNKALRHKLREAGVTSSGIKSIELGLDVDGVRIGGVVERNEPDSQSEVGYTFIEINRPSEKRPIGINHRLFHERCDDGGQCTLMKALDSGFIIPFGSGSEVRVTAHPESSVAKLWGTTKLHGIASQFEQMEFSVRISSGIPISADSDH